MSFINRFYINKIMSKFQFVSIIQNFNNFLQITITSNKNIKERLLKFCNL